MPCLYTPFTRYEDLDDVYAYLLSQAQQSLPSGVRYKVWYDADVARCFGRIKGLFFVYGEDFIVERDWLDRRFDPPVASIESPVFLVAQGHIPDERLSQEATVALDGRQALRLDSVNRLWTAHTAEVDDDE
jgi:hypothetical protein